MYLVHERVFLQQTVSERFLARAYGAKDALASWGFGIAFLAAGGLLALTDPRAVFVIAGGGALLAAGLTAIVLHRAQRKLDAGQTTPDRDPRLSREAPSYVEAPTR